MSRTNSLRKLVRNMLSNIKTKYNIKEIYYQRADKDKIYPHLILYFDKINLGDLHRQDIVLTIDVFDKSQSPYTAENISDDIEALFNANNYPNNDILPTFYLETRRTVYEDDAEIQHKQIEISIQNYDNEVI